MCDFRGSVTYIDPNIKPQARTAQVRVELDNPGEIIKLAVYGNVAFGSTGTAERTVLVVPTAAVQNMNDKQVVFTTTDKLGVFIAVLFASGKENKGRFTVLEGLNVGDKIVTDGNFLLLAELLKKSPQ